MPLYEYACSRCEHEFELLIRGDEKPLCPECGERRVEKRFSVPAAPAKGGASLPLAGRGESCGAPSCCLGACRTP